MINKILKVLKKIFDIFKKIFHAIGNYFYNIGKELKEWFKSNWKEILIVLGCFSVIPLFFILPKIMLIVFVTLFILGIMFFVSLIIWANLYTGLEVSKYPNLLITFHILFWILWIVICIFGIYLIDRSIYFGEL